MILSKSNIKYVLFSILLELIIIGGYFWGDPKGKIVVTAGFLLTLVFLIKFRKCLPILILFIFFILYNYASLQVFYKDFLVSAYPGFRGNEWINRTFFIHSLFIFSIGNTINRKNLAKKINLNTESFKSKYLFWIFVIVGLLMIQFGIKGQNMLQSGGYGLGSTKSTLHEYYILLYFLTLLVCPKNNFLYKIVLIGLYLLYCIKTILFGGRAEVLEISLLILMYYWLLPKKEKKWVLFLLLSFALYINTIVSNIRSNPLAFLKGNYFAYLNPFFSASGEQYSKYLGNNQGDVIQSSNRVLALIQDGYFDTATRIKSFFGMLGSVFLPTSAFPDYINLAAYHQIHPYRSGGGGLISVYFFTWMGYFGPVFIGLFLGYFLNKGFDPKSNIAFKVYAVILITMSPRWFAYGPILIFKFCFLTALMYVFSKYLFEVFFKIKPSGSLV